MRNPFRQAFLLVIVVLLTSSGSGLAQWNGEIEAWEVTALANAVFLLQAAVFSCSP
jgi:hypothetical protein